MFFCSSHSAIRGPTPLTNFTSVCKSSIFVDDKCLGVLNRFCLAEICNLSFGISKFFQDLAGMLAQHGCAMANLRGRGRQAYGWRGDWNWSRRSWKLDFL